jgi:outer membrane cobalamin receptor
LCLNIYSQSPKDTTLTLPEVIVIARQFKEVIPSQKLSGKELEALNSLSVADAIRYFSGVQLKDYGGVGGLKTVNIRSMGTNQVGVFYNGIQLGNAQNGQVDLSKFSLDNIEEISLYNGQKSEVFQSARDFGSASSIYLISRKPKFQDGKTTNIKASLRGGSFDLINPSLLMEYKISNKVNMSFNGEWIDASGKYKVHYKRVFPNTDIVAYDTTAIRENSDINATRMETGLYGLLPKGSWNIHAYNYSSDRGVPGAIINNEWKRGERIRDVSSFVQGNLRTIINPRWSTQLNMKYAADYTHFEYFEEKLYPTNNKYRQKEFYLSTSNLFPVTRNWDFSLAYDFQWNTLDADFQRNDNYDIFPYPTRYSNWLSAATAFDWDRWKAQASIQGVFVHETVEKYAKPDDKNVFTPAIFLSYKLLPKEDLNIRAFYKKIFRMATFNEMYYVEMVNAKVKPEYATQYNLGLKYTKKYNSPVFKSLDAQIDIYYNEVDDKIIAIPKSPLFRWTTLNLGHVEIRGMDVSLGNTIQLNKITVNTKLQYTYQKAQDFTDTGDTFYGNQIPYIPWHSGTAILSGQYKGWAFNYSFIYTGERYSQPDNIIYNHVQPWYTSDMSLVWNFKINQLDMKASAEVNNLFDQDYEVIFNYPMPKRNYMFTLTVNL